ncbi:hypothetical protein psyc5s11_43460 [Clostridium gelidum]|uniref:Uncharacterized protein n=2 Tax=Clostridium gelidum TaxID=704125 RepID=A0ABM7TAA3_9CLOT|nr:hypothetical protein psyc5s11_43460 [Clostridium gelidum]
MELNQVMNLLANNVALNEKKANNVNQDNSLVAFENYLSEAGYTQESSAARNIREDIENRLQKITFGSPKVKLTVSPKVYENMAKDPNIKRWMLYLMITFLRMEPCHG